MITPEKTAEKMHSIADRILASKRPSTSKVAAALREVLREVEQAVPEAPPKP